MEARPSNRLICPLLNINTPTSTPDIHTTSHAYFLSIPWTASHLTHPSTIPFTPQCLNPSSSSHDQLFSTTLSGPDALRHMLCFFHAPDHLHDPKKPIQEISTLFAIGPRLCGNEKILHGGMTMAMVDEAMGVMTEVNCALGKDDLVFRSMSVTGGVDIKFLRPIPVDSVVMATSWLEGMEGRKTRVGCVIKDEHGDELVRCTSIWVALKEKI